MTEEVFVNKKVKNTVPWTYLIEELIGKETEFRVEKLVKRKCDKLYVKWKGYDNSFNSWIDKILCILYIDYI